MKLVTYCIEPWSSWLSALAPIQWAAVQITRRHLLTFGALSAGAAAIGVGGTLVCWWDQKHAPDLSYLSPPEERFLTAFATTAYPATETVAMDGAEARLAHYFDALLLPMTSTDRKLIKAVLHVMDNLPRASLGSAFVGLEPQQQTEVLEAWLGHDSYELRALIQMLVLLLGMGYTTHPRVAGLMASWHGCGFGR